MRNCLVSILTTVGLVCLQGLAQAPSAPVRPRITLDDAIRLAQSNEPAFAAAAAESRATALERTDARAALLPSVVFHNQYLYTESNRSKAATTQGGVTESLPVFIANNAIHEYVNQASVTETVGLARVALAARLAGANAARAQAELEIAKKHGAASSRQLSACSMTCDRVLTSWRWRSGPSTRPITFSTYAEARSCGRIRACRRDQS